MTREGLDAFRADGAFCPSCERFIGPAKSCPYCDADSARPAVWRRLRLASLFLGVAGLALLYLTARFREVPVVRIAEISPMMNFAFVRIVGDVARSPYVSTRDGKADYVSFDVRDESGNVRVVAYRDVARALAQSGRVPTQGSRVDVRGTVSVSADGGEKLRLQDAAQLVVTAGSPAGRPDGGRREP